MDVSVLIVSFNTRELTLACLESVYAQTQDVEFEVIVVDNASTDGSAAAVEEGFSAVRLLALSENRGFAAATNLAAEHARGEFLLLLNPDTVVLVGAVQQLVRFAREQGGRGVFGGRTLYPDGSLNHASCWGRITLWSTLCEASGLSSLLRRSRWLDPESLGSWRRDEVRDVDIVSGCLMLIDHGSWRELGGFDPAFFMYGEDADLCLRAAARGLPVRIDPRSLVVHYGGASERVPAEKLVRLLDARRRLVRRHFGPWKARLGVFLMGLRPATRALTWRILALLGRPGAEERARSWAEVRSRVRGSGSA